MIITVGFLFFLYFIYEIKSDNILNNHFLKLNNMPNYYCEYCGTKYANIPSLVGTSCYRHPLGSNKGKHKLYEGSEKPNYNCKYCGTASTSLTSLTGTSCFRHPNGSNKGKHAPAL